MKITFVGPAISRFVQNDIHILSREHELTVVDSAMGRGGSAVFNLIKLHLKIIASVFRTDSLFFWFADYYTYIPTLIAKLFGKKVFVVAGGFDVAYIPEVKSGARTRKGRWFMVRNTFRSVDHVFPVSNYALTMLKGSVPDHAPATVIYNAVDTSRFLFGSGQRKNIALTVTQLDTVLDYRLKGIDVFIKAAAHMPDTIFELIGIRGPALEHARLEAKDLSNMTIVEGPVEFASLLEKYHTASAYCQLSMDESFGVATAEAMSCGCIPVVSQVPSLEEVTGGTGHIVSRASIEEVCDAIRATFTAPIETRKRASEYVRKFDIAERAKHLLGAV
ncbi:MAG TPA: glycosyltransferase [Candidatus Kapabacteria bacterium]